MFMVWLKMVYVIFLKYLGVVKFFWYWKYDVILEEFIMLFSLKVIRWWLFKEMKMLMFIVIDKFVNVL